MDTTNNFSKRANLVVSIQNSNQPFLSHCFNWNQCHISQFATTATTTTPITKTKTVVFPWIVTTKNRFRTMSTDTNNDEVEKAKVAAEAYESSDKDGAGPATVFDKLLSKEWNSDVVYEDDIAYAFRDIAPQAPVHILVIPKHRDGLVKLSKARENQKDILGHLMYVAQQIGKQECPNGFRIVINDGKDGAQSVYHLHLHILGGRQLAWPPG